MVAPCALGPPDRLYLPGSSTKFFSVSAALDDLGFDHRFQTPVYARGEVKDGALSGDLVLVASGDLTMGGQHGLQRRLPDDEILLEEGRRRSGPGSAVGWQGATPPTGLPRRRRRICCATG